MNILVVDDERGIREFFARELASEGYHVETAFDGEDALSQLDSHSFDLMICDLKMPRLGGLEVLEAVHQRGLKTRVIMMTGCMMEEAALVEIQKKADHFIPKPFDLEEILALIKKAISDDYSAHAATGNNHE